MFILPILIKRNLWVELMMSLLLLMITMFPLILLLDIECNVSCPIILGRPFLRTVGAIIDMKEGNIRFQFPLRRGMEHFPRKRKKLCFESIIRSSYALDVAKASKKT